MLLLGHTGITLGIAGICDILGSANSPLNTCRSSSGSQPATAIRGKVLTLYGLLSRIRRQVGSIDYRLVLLGSLLPDILDKPLWFLSSAAVLPSGRAYGHTLLLNLILLICGVVLVRYRRSWLLVLSSSSFAHLMLDGIWNNPGTLWWPLMGPFLRVETTGWLTGIAYTLSSDPGSYVPETIGLIVIVFMGYRQVIKKNVISFLRTGTIG